MDVKVTSYNIHSCIGTDNLYSVDRIANVIQKENPDIVCLQEVEVNDSSLKNRIWSKHHCEDQPELITNRVGGLKYHVFVPAIRSRAESNWKEKHQDISADCDDVLGRFDAPLPKKLSRNKNTTTNATSNCERKTLMDTGRFGLAILSKFPILQIKIHYYKRYKNKTQRNAMACLVALPNKMLIWVVNTHLGCHFIGKEQAQQSKELVSFIYSLERRSDNIRGVIICGDFNSPPWYSCVKELKSQRYGLQDVWEHSPSGKGGTFPSHEQVISKLCGRCIRKLLRLDYIFLTGHIQCKVVYVYDDCSDASLASDHLPLCAVLFIDT